MIGSFLFPVFHYAIIVTTRDGVGKGNKSRKKEETLPQKAQRTQREEKIGFPPFSCVPSLWVQAPGKANP
jgi:hypothetical protein